MSVIKIKLFENGMIPLKAHEDDAAFDCFVSGIKKKSWFKIHYTLGFATDMPADMFAKVYPRSSIHKRHLLLSNSTGIIDNGYRGEWQAVFYKIPFFSSPYKVGDACCQAIFEKSHNVTLRRSKELSTSVRGDNGFGSTDKK